MSDEARWHATDNYFAERLLAPDAVLDAALRESAAAGLPAIAVSPVLGAFLNLLLRIRGARRVLEIGTLGGYSTIWMARALPEGGRLVTLEADPKHAAVARANIERAGLAHVVDLRVGRAAETLPLLAGEAPEPFDVVFIDADKPSNPIYFEWALKLTRAGSVIVLDNVARNGEVANAASTDPSVIGTRAFMDMVHRHPRLDATALQMVGVKGYDGFLLALVKG